MLKLKFQYVGHLMQRADSLEKSLMLGKIEGRRRRGWQDEMVEWHHRLDGHEFAQAPRVGNGQESLSNSREELDVTEQLNWLTELWLFKNNLKWFWRASVHVVTKRHDHVNNTTKWFLYNLSCVWSEVAQLCPTLCDPMDCSLSESSVHGIFQARVLEWVAI